MTFEIKPATPTNTYIRLALAGQAGSGKTLSALRLATGFGGKIVVIDTENCRAKKYAADFTFHHIDFQPPFRPSRYQEALKAATDFGADTIIIDSVSHEHEGDGGVLEMAENFLNEKAGTDYKKRERLKMSAWIKPKSERNRLIQHGLQRVNANVILCFRAKEKMEIKKLANKDGKLVNTPVPMGLQPIGSDAFYYEMDILAMLPAGSQGKPDWDCPAARINDFNGSLIKALHETTQFTEKTGEIIKRLNSTPATPADPALINAGKAAVEKGLVAYREWKGTLPPDQLDLIRPHNKEWSYAAKAVDDEPTTEPSCATCNDTGMIEGQESDPDTGELVPFKKPCPDCGGV